MRTFLFLLLVSTSAMAQREDVYFNHLKSQPEIFLLSEKLLDLIGHKAHLTSWNTETQSYISDIPGLLTQADYKSRTIRITTVDKMYLKDYFRGDWNNFSIQKLDSTFAKNDAFSESILSFDSTGRLIHLESISKRKKGAKEKISIDLIYSMEAKRQLIQMNVSKRSFEWFSHYSSSHSGNFNGVPLWRKWNWKVKTYINAHGVVDSVYSSSRKRANWRKDSDNDDYAYSYTYDQKNRIIRNTYYNFRDSIIESSAINYSERALDLKQDSVSYKLLNSPPLLRWLSSIESLDELMILKMDNNSENLTYLVNKDYKVLISLSTFPSANQKVFYTYKNNEVILNSRLELSKLPDHQDTIPFSGYRTLVKDPELPENPFITTLERNYPGMIYFDRLLVYRQLKKDLNNNFQLNTFSAHTESGQEIALGHIIPIVLDNSSNYNFLFDSNNELIYYSHRSEVSKVSTLE